MKTTEEVGKNYLSNSSRSFLSEARISNPQSHENGKKKEENVNKKTFSTRTTTGRIREMKMRLPGKLQEQKMYRVSAPGPQLQFGRPPTAG